MKRIVLGLIVSFGLIGGIVMWNGSVDAATCSIINNSDQRNKCYATAKRDPTYCSLIRDRDSQNWCYVGVTGNRVYCQLLTTFEGRNACLAQF